MERGGGNMLQIVAVTASTHVRKDVSSVVKLSSIWSVLLPDAVQISPHCWHCIHLLGRA